MAKPRVPVTHLAPLATGGPHRCCGRLAAELDGDDLVTGEPGRVTCRKPERKLATRHFCPHEGKPGSGLRHDSGSGRPPRVFCRGCGGILLSAYGLYGVFAWRGDGRYPVEAAQVLRVSDAKAQAWADAHNRLPGTPKGGYVVRWVPDGELK